MIDVKMIEVIITETKDPNKNGVLAGNATFKE